MGNKSCKNSSIIPKIIENNSNLVKLKFLILKTKPHDVTKIK